MGNVLDLKKKDVKDELEESPVEQAQPEKKTQPKEDVALDQPRFVFTPEKIAWSGPQYYKYGGDNAPLIVCIAFVVIAIGIGIFLGEIISAILIGMVGLTVYMQSKRVPPLVHFEITPLLIRVGPKEYSYKDLTSFWIEYLPALNVSELSLQLKKWYHPYIKIPLQSQDPVQVREILIEFIAEKEHERTVIDYITNRLGL